MSACIYKCSDIPVVLPFYTANIHTNARPLVLTICFYYLIIVYFVVYFRTFEVCF